LLSFILFIFFYFRLLMLNSLHVYKK